jgi:hypothetical protein
MVQLPIYTFQIWSEGVGSRYEIFQEGVDISCRTIASVPNMIVVKTVQTTRVGIA